MFDRVKINRDEVLRIVRYLLELLNNDEDLLEAQNEIIRRRIDLHANLPKKRGAYAKNKRTKNAVI